MKDMQMNPFITALLVWDWLSQVWHDRTFIFSEQVVEGIRKFSLEESRSLNTEEPHLMGDMIMPRGGGDSDLPTSAGEVLKVSADVLRLINSLVLEDS